MKWAYSLAGGDDEPIIMDLPAYDATTILQGALVKQGATAFASGSDASRGVINAYSTTVASAHAANTLGIALETKTTSDAVSIATALNTTAAVAWVKTIVNPLAVYRAAYNTAQCTQITTCATTHLACTFGAAASSVDGFMIYNVATGGPNFGHLGFVANSVTAGSMGIDVAWTNTATTADYLMLISPPGRFGMPLSTDSTMIGAITSGTAGIGTLTRLGIIETYVDADRGFMRMNINGPWIPPVGDTHMSISYTKYHPATRGDGFKKGTNKSAQFYSDLIQRSHVWGAVTA